VALWRCIRAAAASEAIKARVVRVAGGHTITMLDVVMVIKAASSMHTPFQGAVAAPGS
jgi:hypothetical protein